MEFLASMYREVLWRRMARSKTSSECDYDTPCKQAFDLHRILVAGGNRNGLREKLRFKPIHRMCMSDISRVAVNRHTCLLQAKTSHDA